MKITPPVATSTLAPGLPPIPAANDLTEPLQLTTRPAFRGALAIDGSTVVWLEREASGLPQIVAYDLPTHQERRLSTLPGGKASLHISGRYVVWDEAYAASDQFVQEVHAYDLVRGQELMLGEGELPDISGQRVVWKDSRTDPGSPLVLYDLGTRQARHLTGLRGKGAYIAGDWIIYASHILNTSSQASLFAYNLVTGESVPLGDVYDPPEAKTNKYMAIDWPRVVWQDTHGQAHVYDLGRRTASLLEGLQIYPAGHFSRGVLLQSDHALSLVDGSTFRTLGRGSTHLNYAGETIPDAVIGQFANDGETLVWTACRGGDSTDCPTNEVFLARRRR
jgi:hypothetical protein